MKTAKEEAPQLQIEEYKRIHKEEARAKRLAERWENATREKEKVEAMRAEKRRLADTKKASRLGLRVKRLQELSEQAAAKRGNATAGGNNASIGHAHAVITTSASELSDGTEASRLPGSKVGSAAPKPALRAATVKEAKQAVAPHSSSPPPTPHALPLPPTPNAFAVYGKDRRIHVEPIHSTH